MTIFQAREYQDDAEGAIWNYFEHQTGNPVIAMPTGTGKGVVIGRFCSHVLERWPTQRIVCMTHVKELIQQNYDKMLSIWPEAPVGIFSAGIGRKEAHMPITFAGAASVRNAIELFGHVDLCLIDECHLLNPNADSTYQKIIAAWQAINPYMKVVGFSATPYRMGQGMITDGGVFTDIAIDMTDLASFNWFIEQGYLSNLIPRPLETMIDVSGVSIQNGDYAQGQLESATEKVTYGAIKEALEYASDRYHWLLFAAGNDNAEHSAQILNSFGIPTTFIHHGVTKSDREERLADYRAGRYRCITNNNVLTTGFDDSNIDCIIMLRKTMSPGLWVQMLGRGTRPAYAPGYDLSIKEGRLAAIAASWKRNCLVLDFARNTRDLGPINDPRIPKAKSGQGGEAPVKLCPKCGAYNHASVRYCINCGFEFEFGPGFQYHSGTEEIIKTETPILEWFPVNTVLYRAINSKAMGIPMLKVTYISGFRQFSELVMLEHQGYAARKAREWWRSRHWSDPPPTIEEALKLTNELRKPVRVNIWINKKYPEVMNYEYE